MADKPILFSGPMVRALLDGRKTQTRRIPKLPRGVDPSHFMIDSRYIDPKRGISFCHWPEDDAVTSYQQPAYRKGDRLWVREAHRLVGWDEDGDTWFEYLADGARSPRLYASEDFDCDSMIIKACDAYEAAGVQIGEDGCYQPSDFKLPGRPSIFMPRWVSRLTLTVTDVRVQRVQEISEEDAIAEGPGFVGKISGEVCESVASHRLGIGPRWKNVRDWYADLWDSINAKPRPRRGNNGEIVCYESFPWDGESRTETYRGKPRVFIANPWVAAYTFTVQIGNIDEVKADG